MCRIPIGLKSVLCAGLLAGLLLCPMLHAQTNWAVEGGLPSYGEFNNPPPGAMTNPMPYSMFLPAGPPPPIPGNLPFPPMAPLFGGSAVDNNGNILSGGPMFPVMIHSDGLTVEIVTTAGAYVSSYAAGGGAILPGTISGVGCDSLLDITWLTDGALCAGVGLPPAPGVPPPMMVPPFPLPLLAGVLASGLDWDPFTGTLWFCDMAGMVTNCMVGGAFLLTFPAAPLAGPLMGLTVNTTNGNIQVTDGLMVAEFLPAGPLAPPGAFYLSANPYPIMLWSAPVSGLGFSLNPQRYGAGWSAAGMPPAIGSGGGNSFAGNGGFFIQETGATPGSSAYLIYGFSPAVPGLPIGPGFPGASIWINPFFVIYLGSVPASGTFVLPIAIPPVGAVGAPCFAQFLNILGLMPTKIELSDALSFTIGML
ncbi:MAG: hypothetical protein ABIK28_15315 [Planctomycetota bacterium]